jgi:hypothetical protein
MEPSQTFVVRPHDLAAIVDPLGLSPVARNAAAREREVNGGKAAPRAQKAMLYIGRVRVRPHDLAAIVDPKGLSPDRAKHINRGDRPLLSPHQHGTREYRKHSQEQQTNPATGMRSHRYFPVQENPSNQDFHFGLL